MLKVNNLTIQLNSTIAVNNLSFTLEQGEILGVVGESGSGKTMTALSIAGLLPKQARLEGSILFNDIDLTRLSAKERMAFQGKEISVVFQEPMTSLNPVMKIGKQLEEMLTLHFHYSLAERRQRIYEALSLVELDQPERIVDSYPFQLSGGMQQRVMIAMAILGEPKLIIADEPTTALDVEVQDQILRLFKKINQQKNTSILFISHDLQVIKQICDKTMVMQNGDLIEAGTIEEVFYHPKEVYTQNLIASIANEKKTVIPNDGPNILEIRDLTVYYEKKKKKQIIIQNFNLEIKEGEILGIIGRSGKGKTTLCNTIIGLHKNYTGDIIHSSDMPQMIFQDAYGSLNPAKTIGWILEETLKIARKLSKPERLERVKQMLEKVGLSESFKDRRAHELSGGQRQRVSIALALMLGSKLILADEPVSALDVTIQSQILDLLLSLQKEYRLSILFISHDLSVMNKVCDRIIKI